MCTVYLFQKSTQKNKNTISNSSLVALFCNGKSLCTVYLFQKSNIQTQKYYFNIFSCCLFAKENFSVLLTFFKRVTDKHKNIISIYFLVGVFCKGKSLCTVYLFQKINTQTKKYYFNIFFCWCLLQRKISVYCLLLSKECHTNTKISFKFLFLLVSFAKESLCVLFTFFNRLTHNSID